MALLACHRNSTRAGCLASRQVAGQTLHPRQVGHVERLERGVSAAPVDGQRRLDPGNSPTMVPDRQRDQRRLETTHCSKYRSPARRTAGSSSATTRASSGPFPRYAYVVLAASTHAPRVTLPAQRGGTQPTIDASEGRDEVERPRTTRSAASARPPRRCGRRAPRPATGSVATVRRHRRWVAQRDRNVPACSRSTAISSRRSPASSAASSAPAKSSHARRTPRGRRGPAAYSNARPRNSEDPVRSAAASHVPRVPRRRQPQRIRARSRQREAMPGSPAASRR